jgi:hypothetical protein
MCVWSRNAVNDRQMPPRGEISGAGVAVRFCSVEYHPDLASSPSIRLDLRQGAIPVPGPRLWENILNVAFHKRACYEYEKEWRAVLYQDSRPEAGVDVNFDLDTLIDAVWVGPRSEPFFLDVVSSIMNKFGLSKPLDRSRLLCPPQKNSLPC